MQVKAQVLLLVCSYHVKKLSNDTTCNLCIGVVLKVSPVSWKLHGRATRDVAQSKQVC